MQKIVIDCATGRASLVDLTTDEQADLTARQTAPDPIAQGRATAAQRTADLDAMLTQFRSKTTTEPVVGKQAP